MDKSTEQQRAQHQKNIKLMELKNSLPTTVHHDFNVTELGADFSILESVSEQIANLESNKKT